MGARNQFCVISLGLSFWGVVHSCLFFRQKKGAHGLPCILTDFCEIYFLSFLPLSSSSALDNSFKSDKYPS